MTSTSFSVILADSTYKFFCIRLQEETQNVEMINTISVASTNHPAVVFIIGYAVGALSALVVVGFCTAAREE